MTALLVESMLGQASFLLPISEWRGPRTSARSSVGKEGQLEK